MSTFEFISVLLSIVVGLGLTRLLSGLGRALEVRGSLRIYWVQAMWVVNVCLTLVVFWWATLSSHATIPVWPFLNFANLLLYAVFLYLQAVLIIPSKIEEGTNLEAHFFAVRPWFFTFGAVVASAEVCDTLLHGGWERVLGFGPFYLAITFGGILLNAVGVLTADRRFHAAFCLAYFLGMAGWMLIGFSTVELGVDPGAVEGAGAR
jgi:hypothetical protein